MTPDETARILNSFDQQTLMHTFGAKLARVDKGCVVVEAPILPGSKQQHGVAHAGLTFSIGDSAAGYSAMTLLAPDQEVMTAEMKINLLAPAKGDLLRATGKVIKSGRRLIVVSAEVHALTPGKEVLVAVLQGTIVPLRN